MNGDIPGGNFLGGNPDGGFTRRQFDWWELSRGISRVVVFMIPAKQCMTPAVSTDLSRKLYNFSREMWMGFFLGNCRFKKIVLKKEDDFFRSSDFPRWLAWMSAKFTLGKNKVVKRKLGWYSYFILWATRVRPEPSKLLKYFRSFPGSKFINDRVVVWPNKQMLKIFQWFFRIGHWYY